MTAALLFGVAALLAWPVRHAPARLPRWRSQRRPPPLADALRSPSAALVATGAGLLGAVLSTPLVAVLTAGCALVAVRAWRTRQQAAAAAAGLLALSEALAVLAAELTAGRAFDRAVGTAGGACPEAGTDRALVAALRDEPIPPVAAAGAVLTALDRVRQAARLSIRTGCSLAAVTAALADDLRARHRAGLELRSATAGPRASATVLAGLPVVGLAMGSGIGADPWHVLTATAVGQALLVAGVLLELLGIAWTGRLLRRAVASADSAAGGHAR